MPTPLSLHFPRNPNNPQCSKLLTNHLDGSRIDKATATLAIAAYQWARSGLRLAAAITRTPPYPRVTLTGRQSDYNQFPEALPR